MQYSGKGQVGSSSKAKNGVEDVANVAKSEV
jgi:hypothetical protein